MVEAQEREEPLSEAKAGKILDAVYEKALNGIPMVSRSVDEIGVKGQNVCLARRVAGVRFGLFECRLSGCSRCR